MLLRRSSVLFVFSALLVNAFPGTRSPIPYSVLHVGTLVLSVPLLSLVLFRSSQADPTRFVRYKWCAWSDWTRCSPEPCYAGVRRNRHEVQDRPAELADDGDQSERTVANDQDAEVAKAMASNYCVVKPGPLSHRDVHPLLVQVTIDGVVKRREPAKQRIRTCTCQSISLWRFIGVYKKDECTPDTIQVECGKCGLDEKVYQTRHYEFDESVLPFCDQSGVGSVQLYKILGGIAGAVILILFIVWIVRMLVRTVFRSSGSSASASGGGRGLVPRADRDHSGAYAGRRGRDRRSSRSGRGAACNDMTDPLQLPATMSQDSELPPSYKDVVSNIPGVMFVGPDPSYVEADLAADEPHTDRFVNRLRKPRSSGGRRGANDEPLPTAPSPPAQQIASSSQTGFAHRSRTPPPPSYEDVMSSPVMELGNGPGEAFRLVQMTGRTSAASVAGVASEQAGNRTGSNAGRVVHSAENAGGSVVGGGDGTSVQSPAQTVQRPVQSTPSIVSNPSTESRRTCLPASIVEATTPG